MQQLDPHTLAAGQQVPPTQLSPEAQQFVPHDVSPAEQQRGGAAQLSPVSQHHPPPRRVPGPQSTGQQGGPREEGGAPVSSEGPSS